MRADKSVNNVQFAIEFAYLKYIWQRGERKGKQCELQHKIEIVKATVIGAVGSVSCLWVCPNNKNKPVQKNKNGKRKKVEEEERRKRENG